ncbi:uncharacterized protein LOC142348649 [Convolutriloba macropyga]|uniref:uncharacterized protein LOC142348649 n=1 Tax=Convolutriloba macropyga TaxID=536237 RepID=UPI003F51BB2C
MTITKIDYEKDVPIHLLCFSLAYASLVLICYMITGFITSRIKDENNFIRFLLLEIIASFQVITGAYEGTCVMFHYGVFWWCVYTASRIILHLYTFRDASADPVMVILEKKLSILKKIVVIIAQISVGFGAYFLMPYVWNWSASNIHAHKIELIHENSVCNFDLKIPFAQAFLLQYVYILSVFYVDYLSPLSVKKVTVPIYLIALAAPGLSYTGMHISVLPLIIFNWYCHDTTTLAIILIYVLPPIAAKLTADRLMWTSSDESDKQTAEVTNSVDKRRKTEDQNGFKKNRERREDANRKSNNSKKTKKKKPKYQ